MMSLENDELDRAIRESRGETQRAQEEEFNRQLVASIAASEAEAEQYAASSYHDEVAAALVASRADAPPGYFQSPQDEEAQVRRAMELSAADHWTKQKAMGAVADNDEDALRTVKERSVQDWHKCTWDQKPPAEEHGEERLHEDPDLHAKGEGKRRQPDLHSHYHQTYYQEGLVQGIGDMHVGGAGHMPTRYTPPPDFLATFGHPQASQGLFHPGLPPSAPPTVPLSPGRSNVSTIRPESSVSNVSPRASSAASLRLPAPSRLPNWGRSTMDLHNIVARQPSAILAGAAAALPPNSPSGTDTSLSGRNAESKHVAEFRAKQQAAYEASLAADREKVQKKKEEDSRKRKMEEARKQQAEALREQEAEDEFRKKFAAEKEEVGRGKQQVPAQAQTKPAEGDESDESEEEEEPEDEEYLKQKRLAFLSRFGG